MKPVKFFFISYLLIGSWAYAAPVTWTGPLLDSSTPAAVLYALGNRGQHIACEYEGTIHRSRTLGLPGTLPTKATCKVFGSSLDIEIEKGF